MGKADEAYEWIKEQIVRGIFPPMTDLSEDELQTQLGMSRTPVREALLRLEQDNLVKIYPRKGTIVTDVTLDVIREVYEVRLLNEPSVVKKAGPFVSREWLKDIKYRLENPPQDASREAVRTYYIELDDELHTTLIEASPNRYLRKALKMVYDQNRRLRYATSQPASETDKSIEEHISIVDALLAQDYDKAFTCDLEHLEKSELRTDNTIIH